MELTWTLVVVVLARTCTHTQAQTAQPIQVAFDGPQAANEASTVRMNCSIAYQPGAPISHQILHKGTEILTQNTDKYALSVLQPGTDMLFVILDVLDVGPADSGAYTCRATTEEGTEQVTRAEATVVLQINYLPSSKYPQCSTLGRALPDPIPDGQLVNLLCSSRTGEPTVTLTWSYTEGTAVVSHTSSERDGYVQSELQVMLSYPLNSEAPVFTCHAASDVFPDYRSNCSLGPFTIASPATESNGMVVSSSGTPLFTSKFTTSTRTEQDNLFTVASTSPSAPSQPVTSSPTSGSHQMPSNAPWMVIVIIALGCLLLLSVITNIFCALRRRCRGSANMVVQDSLYLGLDKVDERDNYTSLTTQAVSLQSVGKKSEVLQANHTTKDSEQDYAQVDLSPNCESKPIHLEDPKYVNYKKKPPKHPKQVTANR